MRAESLPNRHSPRPCRRSFRARLPRIPRALRIAVTSEMHLVARLPVDALDVPVQLIVTEARLHRVV